MIQVGWPMRPLGRCAKFLSGGTPDKTRLEFWDGDIPWVSSGEMTERRIYDTSLHINEDAATDGSRLVPEGTVLAVVRGMSLANEFRVSITKRNVAFNQDIKAFACTPDIDSEFLFYALLARREYIREMATEASHGTKRLETDVLSEFKILVPDRDTQHRVASVFSAYDELIDNNRRRIALLEEVARALYREWFVRLRFPGHEHTRITNGVPLGWKKTTAFSAMEILSGGTPKTTVPDYWDGELPFYTPKDGVEACYVLETERCITELGLKNCNSRLYDRDTVFISARGTVGKLNLASVPMAMSQSCYALVGRGQISQLFLFCALRETIEHFKQHAVGAVFDAIVVDTFKLIPFMVPDAKKVRLFDEMVAPTFRQVANLLEQNRRLNAARDLLLPRVMNGEIAV
jgi:type I restriction enzyme S subunit